MWGLCTELFCLENFPVGACENSNEPDRFHERRGLSWAA